MSIDNVDIDRRDSIYDNVKEFKIENEQDLIIESDVCSPLEFLSFECWCEYVEQNMVLINDIACVEHKLNIVKRIGKE